MQKNDITELTITDINSEGDGVGKTEGAVVFVPAAAVGDRLLIRILKAKTNLCYGRIERIIEPSPQRCDTLCASFPRCGGCRMRHMNYDEELRIKENLIKSCFKKIAGIDISLDGFMYGSPDGYRNKAEYRFIDENGNIRAGFYARRSHRVITADRCAIHPAEFAAAATAVCEVASRLRLSVYDEISGSGLLRSLLLRKAEKSDEYMAVIIINGNNLPGAVFFENRLNDALRGRLKSFQININKDDTNVVLGKKCRILDGESYITDVLCGKKIRVSPLSFYQVNRDMAEKLYETVSAYINPSGKSVLDLYCGVGAIGLSMCDKAKEITGVETEECAVNDAKANAKLNGAGNMTFIKEDAYSAAKELAKSGRKTDAAVIDPPRKGCGKALLNVLADSFSPNEIVYVSCNPATLARDSLYLYEYGYRLTNISAVDMFPRTQHVETVAAFKRQRYRTTTVC